MAEAAKRPDLAHQFISALGDNLNLRAIKRGVLSYSPEDGRGYLVLPFEGYRDHEYVAAFFEPRIPGRPFGT